MRLEDRMSCDLFFQNEKGHIIVVSAGAWSVVSRNDGTVEINYPYSSSTTGVMSTNVKISIDAFLNYKKECESNSADANLTNENLQHIIAEFEKKKVKQTYNKLSPQ